jgi:hypothetical protein
VVKDGEIVREEGVDGDVVGLESAHGMLRPTEERRGTVEQELGAEESVDPRPWTSTMSKSQGAGQGGPGGQREFHRRRGRDVPRRLMVSSMAAINGLDEEGKGELEMADRKGSVTCTQMSGREGNSQGELLGAIRGEGFGVQLGKELLTVGSHETVTR